MKICLFDVDSKIPNVALMKLSAYHKRLGDDVSLGWLPWEEPDLCYASKIFDFTPEPLLPECECIVGGSGYLTSNIEIEGFDKIMPDYSLYGCDYAIGRFSRGCPNRCPWCVVPKMDGEEVRKVADLRDFWQGQKVVRVLDDNLMQNKGLFTDACEQLHDAKVRTIWEALDIRLVDDDIAHALASVKLEKSIHFAWDGPAQDRAIEPGIATLERHGLKPYKLVFYVLVGFNTTREYDLFRINRLRELGANPFVMPFNRKDPYQRNLARWCNNKVIFKTCPNFDRYENR